MKESNRKGWTFREKKWVPYYGKFYSGPTCADLQIITLLQLHMKVKFTVA